MGKRYRRQEEHRIELSDGDYLIVRKHLTAGEEREAYANIIAGAVVAGEKPTLNPRQIGIAQAVAYLLDWNLTDADDQPIRIRDKSYDFVAAALGAQTPESLREILDAIAAHDAASTFEREQEKKTPSGVGPLSAT